MTINTNTGKGRFGTCNFPMTLELNYSKTYIYFKNFIKNKRGCGQLSNDV